MDLEELTHLVSLCVHCRVKVPASNRFCNAYTLEEEFVKAAEGVVHNIEYESAFNYAEVYEVSALSVPLIRLTHHTLNLYGFLWKRTIERAHESMITTIRTATMRGI